MVSNPDDDIENGNNSPEGLKIIQLIKEIDSLKELLAITNNSTAQCEFRTFLSMVFIGGGIFIVSRPELAKFPNESTEEALKSAISLFSIMFLILITRIKALKPFKILLKFILPLFIICVGIYFVTNEELLVGPTLIRAGIFFILTEIVSWLICTQQAHNSFINFFQRCRCYYNN